MELRWGVGVTSGKDTVAGKPSFSRICVTKRNTGSWGLEWLWPGGVEVGEDASHVSPSALVELCWVSFPFILSCSGPNLKRKPKRTYL